MITIHYQRQLPYPPVRLLAQYFDLEHLEHVHPRSFGKARLVSQHQNVVIWDLEQPPLLGIRSHFRHSPHRLPTRQRHRHPPDKNRDWHSA